MTLFYFSLILENDTYGHDNLVLIFVFSPDGGSAAHGVDFLREAAGGLSSSLSCCNSGPEHKKPVTAQERQREREEKRRKRQERAMERKRKLKEKEKKEGKRGESLGGVLLSDNDKKLLERWGRMMDRVDKSQTAETNGAKTSESKTVQIQPATGSNLVKTNSVGVESLPPKQPNEVPHMLPQMGQCATSGIFHPTPTRDAAPISLGPAQNGDVGIVAVGAGGSVGGLGVVTPPFAFAKNNILKSQCLSVGTMFTGLENWAGTSQNKTHQPPPELNHPAHTGFPHLQTQPKPVPQSNAHIQLLPLEPFMTKPPALNPSIGVSDTSTNLETGDGPQTLDKLCVLGDRQNGSHSQGPSKQPHGAAAQPCFSLTDTGQSTNSIPDIHTVTQQLSKSQVKIYS